MNSNKESLGKITSLFQYLLLATAFLAFSLIVLGVILRVSGSNSACLDWPTCSGSLTEPIGSPTFLPFLHRIIAFVTSIGVTASLLVAWRYYRDQPWIVKPLSAAAVMMVLQILLGRFISIQANSPIMSGTHFFLALGVLALSLIPLVILIYGEFSQRAGKAKKIEEHIQLKYNSPFSRLTLVTLIAVLFLFISGSWVSAIGAQTGCQGWPLCEEIIPLDSLGWVNLIHRIITLVAGILVSLLIVQAWRTQRSQTGILVATSAAAVLFFSQGMMGIIETSQNYPAYLIGLHTSTASAVWAALVIQVTLVGLAVRWAADERAEA
jgi:heme A synthase